MTEAPTPPFRCGYLGLIGRPNAGKSTLLNAILGGKYSITSPKPQTTRNRVVGIYTDDQAQMLLVDTPGHHDPTSELNRRMVQVAEAALGEVDLSCFIVDASVSARRAKDQKSVIHPGERHLLELVEAAGRPWVLVLNKCDRLEPQWLLPVIEAWRQEASFQEAVPVSALTGKGVQELLQVLRPLLPEHPPYYPPDQATENSERFIVAELIRERLFKHLEQELPYSTAVEIERFQEGSRGAGKITINARILVERATQKAIVLGKGGSMIKKIGSEARQELEQLLGCHVRLELFVAVKKGWTKNPRILRELGYPDLNPKRGKR